MDADASALWQARRIVFFHELKADLTRQPVLLIWGALLLAIYFTGWWRHAEEFNRIGLAVFVTFFLTAPSARGVIVSLGLFALVVAYIGAHWGPQEKAEVKAVTQAVEHKATQIGKALKQEVKNGRR